MAGKGVGDGAGHHDLAVSHRGFGARADLPGDRKARGQGVTQRRSGAGIDIEQLNLLDAAALFQQGLQLHARNRPATDHRQPGEFLRARWRTPRAVIAAVRMPLIRPPSMIALG